MAVTKKVQKTVDIWKKKRWHRIIAPKLFNEQIIGDTPALEPNMLLGRTIAVSLVTLTKDMKKQGVYVTFEVDKVMGDTAFTHVKKYEMTTSSIKRLVRRNRDRIDDSFLCLTADNVPVRVKPFLLTRTSTKHSVGTILRRMSRDFLMRTVRKLPYEVLLYDIISTKLQKAWRDTIKNIYPLKACDIRVLALDLKDKRLEEVMTPVAVPVEEQPRQDTPEQEEKHEKKARKKTAVEEQATEAIEAPSAEEEHVAG